MTRLCGKGLHEMTAENTYVRQGDGSRACRECRRVRNRRHTIHERVTGQSADAGVCVDAKPFIDWLEEWLEETDEEVGELADRAGVSARHLARLRKRDQDVVSPVLVSKVLDAAGWTHLLHEWYEPPVLVADRVLTGREAAEHFFAVYGEPTVEDHREWRVELRRAGWRLYWLRQERSEDVERMERVLREVEELRGLEAMWRSLLMVEPWLQVAA